MVEGALLTPGADVPKSGLLTVTRKDLRLEILASSEEKAVSLMTSVFY